MAYGRLQVQVGRVQVLGHEVARRDLKSGHTGVIVVPGRDTWRDKQVMVGWLTVVFAKFLLLGCSPQACEMVVTSQLDYDLVPVLTEDVEVDSVICVAPELEIFVARPRIDVRDYDELPRTVVIVLELVTQPVKLFSTDLVHAL